MVISIGVIAIQGAVEEHVNCMKKIGCSVKEIRVPTEIDGVDGIILPGGESTAMAIVGEKCGLFPALKEWVQAGKPVWGTCAGMILLSDHAIKKAQCGQSLVGGLDVHVCRNFFGSQMYSCELDLKVDEKIFSSGDSKIDESINAPLKAVFIRAPAILKAGEKVEILASLIAKPHISAVEEVKTLLKSVKPNVEKLESPVVGKRKYEETSEIVEKPCDMVFGSSSEEFDVIVAVKQGFLLATAFHPELTKDLRWHRMFLNMIVEHKSREI